MVCWLAALLSCSPNVHLYQLLHYTVDVMSLTQNKCSEAADSITKIYYEKRNNVTASIYYVLTLLCQKTVSMLHRLIRYTIYNVNSRIQWAFQFQNVT